MPELRQNVATREWVVIATERAKRPENFVSPEHALTESRPAHVADCPFCPGNEHMTEPPILSIDDGVGWALRIVPNKFPALSSNAGVERSFCGIERRMAGFGFHEVLVESRQHNTTTALLSDLEVVRLLFAFRKRGKALAEDSRLMMAIYFKNHGPSAGTSLAHPHCQLIGVPVVPHTVRARLQDALAYFDEHGSCAFCDMWRQELEAGARVIVAGKHCLSFIPFAALSPFHIWIVPTRHMPLFTQATNAEIEDLAEVLRVTLAKLYHGLRDPDFNFAIRNAPTHEGTSRSFHWYISIVPKVSKMAGFEVGTGMFINPSLPERSAEFLRNVALPSGGAYAIDGPPRRNGSRS
jgi:UDPglucose--hexose-1-phosphate uridylyltransferase